jgi:hypothetical protein
MLRKIVFANDGPLEQAAFLPADQIIYIPRMFKTQKVTGQIIEKNIRKGHW